MTTPPGNGGALDEPAPVVVTDGLAVYVGRGVSQMMCRVGEQTLVSRNPNIPGFVEDADESNHFDQECLDLLDESVQSPGILERVIVR